MIKIKESEGGLLKNDLERIQKKKVRYEKIF